MGNRIRVGLAQINNSFSGQNYLPLSVGLLQAYAQRNLKNPALFEFLPPLYKRCPVKEATERLQDVHIAFFSTYVWNIRLSLEIAKSLKQTRPETLVVFGGPQVPDRVEAFLRDNPFIDLACHGEGEQVAVAILENYAKRDWGNVPSISYIAKDGRLMQNAKASRLTDFSKLPSPFLDGTFDSLIKANPQEKWIGLWETNRGCPFSCTFCDWGSATQAKVYPFDLTRLYGEIEWLAKHSIEFIFCCDANFGILPRDLEIVTRVAETKKQLGYPHALSVQNTKNATERSYMVQKILADAGLNKGVAIALQSIDPTTLQAIKRANISTESYQELQRRFTRDNVETYTDVILALPGETYESFVNGVSTIMARGQHNRIQFNNLSILPNAEMGDPAYQQKHGMITIPTKIINIHGAVDEGQDEVAESQQLVIGTKAMPPEEWVRVRSFGWTTGLLHFDKVLQIPLIVLHETCGASYRELLEIFTGDAIEKYPTLAAMREFFRAKARDIQKGGPEFCNSSRWLNIWWQTDEYFLIELCFDGKFNKFYEEAEKALGDFLQQRYLDLPPDILKQAIQLNQALLKQPFQKENLTLKLSYNLWEFYQSVLRGTPVPLAEGTFRYHIDRTSNTWSSWDEWCREVIWYGHRRGAYLYGNNRIEEELAGHY